MRYPTRLFPHDPASIKFFVFDGLFSFQTLSTNQREWKKYLEHVGWVVTVSDVHSHSIIFWRMNIPSGRNCLRSEWRVWVEKWDSNFISRWHTHPLTLFLFHSLLHTHTHTHTHMKTRKPEGEWVRKREKLSLG